mgnify:CR=1 FL=1
MNGRTKLTKNQKEKMEKLRGEATLDAAKLRKKYEAVKVFVAIPSGTMVHADFAMALAAMANHTTSVSLRIALNNTKGAEIAHSRNMQLAQAEEMGATHIVFIDSDMVFAPITIQRMIDVMLDTASGEQELAPVKILGATVPKRRYPYHQVAKDLEGKRLSIQPNDQRGVIEIGEIGTGLLMIDMSVMKELAQPYCSPFYRDGKNGKPDLMDRVSEDLSLIYKLKDLGHKIYCDIPLSVDTKHIGDVQFDNTSEDFFADAIELRRQKGQEMLNQFLKDGAEAKAKAEAMAKPNEMKEVKDVK